MKNGEISTGENLEVATKVYCRVFEMNTKLSNHPDWIRRVNK